MFALGIAVGYASHYAGERLYVWWAGHGLPLPRAALR